MKRDISVLGGSLVAVGIGLATIPWTIGALEASVQVGGAAVGVIIVGVGLFLEWRRGGSSPDSPSAFARGDDDDSIYIGNESSADIFHDGRRRRSVFINNRHQPRR